MDMKESRALWRRRRERGQSIVEFALMAPILLILLSGLFEFGFLFTYYLAVLDSARNTARAFSDNTFSVTDSDPSCSTSKDFYRRAACEAVNELALEEPTIRLCLNGDAAPPCTGAYADEDDVIISAFSVLREGGPAVVRFPAVAGEQGWAYDSDLRGYGQGSARTGMHTSHFSSAQIMSMLEAGTPNTGYLLVEINYNYHQVLALPWFTQFVGNPIKLHLYALWPLVSAEPTPTP